MVAAGLRENENDDCTLFWYSVIEPWNALGVTSLRIDHTGKEQIGKNNSDAKGGSAKLQRVDGSAYSIAVKIPFSKHVAHGESWLTALKDRTGEYALGALVARMVVDVDLETLAMTIQLIAPAEVPVNSDGTMRLTGLMEKISKKVEHAGEPVATTALRKIVGGRIDTFNGALDILVREKFLSRTNGPRASKLIESARPYRQADDPKSDRYVASIDEPF